jgi:arylsulfatase A-like enzyme
MDTATRIGMVLLAATAFACGRLSPSAVDEQPVAEPSPVLLSSEEEGDPPNVVLILTDDQRWDTLNEMPTVDEELARHGISFERGYVSNPLCCPSRASVLTGQYSHSNGVYTNQNGQPHGGFRAFDDRSTVATWLDEAGYRTGMLGKYFNGYEGPYVPPGWDRWFATYVNGAFYDYLATDDGVVKTYGSDPADYGTAVLANEAVRFIESTPEDTPVFLYFAPHAPHEPAMAAPGDRRAYTDLGPWRPLNYDEADVSDKPAYIRDQPRMDAVASARIDEFRRSQYASLLAVDRAVGTIVDSLDQTGRLSNTLIVYTSDNGMSWGEHRRGRSSCRTRRASTCRSSCASTRSDPHVRTSTWSSTSTSRPPWPSLRARGLPAWRGRASCHCSKASRGRGAASSSSSTCSTATAGCPRTAESTPNGTCTCATGRASRSTTTSSETRRNWSIKPEATGTLRFATNW